MAIKVEKPVEVKGKVKEKKKEAPKKPTADDSAAQRKKFLESLKNAPTGKQKPGSAEFHVAPKSRLRNWIVRSWAMLAASAL